MIKRIWNRVFVGFINGIVIILPLTITIFVIMFVVSKINAAVLEPILRMFPKPSRSIQHIYVVKSLIFIGVLAGISLVGWAARILFIRRAFSWWEKIFLRIPLMGKIYNATKQIATAFLGHGKTIFKQVVLVEYPRKGLYSIGFTTGVVKGELEETFGETAINVFVPTTPNPTSGIYILAPKGQIRFLKMSVEDAMKLVISGGSVIPGEVEEIE